MSGREEYRDYKSLKIINNKSIIII
jgi:hypothetical protein